MDVIDLIEEGEKDYENGDSSLAKSKFLQASSLLLKIPKFSIDWACSRCLEIPQMRLEFFMKKHVN